MIDIIPVFIKADVFNNFGLSWMIQKKKQIDFAADENFPCWFT